MPRQSNRENGKIRVIAIYRMLLEEEKITSRQIIQRLESRYGFTADRKTIYSDIAAIDRIIPIKVITGKNGGYILRDVIGESKEE